MEKLPKMKSSHHFAQHQRARVRALLVFLSAALYFLPPGTVVFAESPTLYFLGPAASVRPGAEFSVTLFVDAPEPVNAYSIRFGYPTDLLAVKGVNTSRSIITVWRNQPDISRSGAVIVAGGSVKAFRGERGEILTITFRALSPGVAKVVIGESTLYLANGKGTPVGARTQALTLNLKDSAPPFDTVAIVDVTPPTINKLIFTDDPFHKERKFVGFSVEDRETGVRATFVRIRRFLLWGEWEEAQNPTAVPRGAWAVALRAVDNAENVSEAVVYNWSSLRSAGLLVAIAVLVVAVSVINTLITRKKRYNKRNA